MPNFYQYLQKSQLHSFKLPVKMEMAEGALKYPELSETPVGIPIYETERNSDVFASAIVRSPSPRKSFGAIQP